MRKTILLLAALIATFTITANAQEKVKVEKKVEITEKNGIKAVTVKETRDGKTTTTVIKSENADAFLKAEEAEMKHEAKTEGKNVHIEKKVIIKEDKGINKK